MIEVARSPDGAESAVGFMEFVVRRRWVVGSGTAFGFLAGVLAAVLIQPVYRAEVKVIAVDHSGANSLTSDVAGALGGLAGVAGLVELGGGDEKHIALEVLKSRSLARQFIQEQKIAAALDPDAEEGGTELDVLNRALRRFDRKIRRVDEDRRTGIVTLAIDWFETKDAAGWANGLVALLNRQIRERAEADARRNLDYLEANLEKTTNVEIREALYRLMESELKAAMLAEVRVEYALKTIDPAVPPDPEDHVRPVRWLLVLGGTLGGFLLGFFFALSADLVAEVRARSRQ